jgi:hypothetical protein
METESTYSAFAGPRRIAGGSLHETLLAAKAYLDRGGHATLLIFEDWSGRQVDFDFRGTPDEVVERVTPSQPGPGRPRLGVVSREVTLLPRHWDWLEQQPSGISAALRRLVDQARKRDPAGERARLAREAASRFMSAMAGDLPGFEEASRALFAGDRKGLLGLTRRWPKDVREHVSRLLRASA